MPLSFSSYRSLFISEAALKENSVISNNADAELLYPIIRAAQDLELRKVLGTSLFADLQTKILNQALNQAELELMLVYIEPVMVWAIMKKAGYYLTFRYFNKGVTTFTSDNSQPVTKDVLDALADDATNNFNQYVDYLIRHLRANRSSFAAYQIIDGPDDIAPLQKAWTSGISLDTPVRNTINGNITRYERY